jgi:hypothetical protein
VNDQNRINDEEWARPENWNALGIYRSALDTRAIVPKRHPRFGVTVNLGHRNGRWMQSRYEIAAIDEHQDASTAAFRLDPTLHPYAIRSLSSWTAPL